MNSFYLSWLAHEGGYMFNIDLVFWIICIIYYTIKIVTK